VNRFGFLALALKLKRTACLKNEPNNTSQGTRISGLHVFRHRAMRALERER